MLPQINGRKKAGRLWVLQQYNFLRVQLDIEKQFKVAYTNVKFLEVQKELRRKSYCYLKLLDVHGSVQTFIVSKHIRVGDSWKDITFYVGWDKTSCDFGCQCDLFEFRGNVCWHVLLTQKNIRTVSSKLSSRGGGRMLRGNTRTSQWMLMICKHYHDLPDLIGLISSSMIVDMESKERWQMPSCHGYSTELREQINKSVCDRNKPVDTPSMEKPDHDDCRVLSPVAVRA